MSRFLLFSALLLATAGCQGMSGCGTCGSGECRPGCWWCSLSEFGYWRTADERLSENAARHRATRRLRAMEDVSVSYGEGYSQAYADIALGGSGVTPALPSRKYCGSAYRTPDGHARVAQWFEGYEAGARDAIASCGDFNYVPPGRFSNPNCEGNGDGEGEGASEQEPQTDLVSSAAPGDSRWRATVSRSPSNHSNPTEHNPPPVRGTPHWNPNYREGIPTGMQSR